ncbi:MAG: hypothetical protein QOH16_1758 [Gaiellaceae bacterium]|nr:hypothetical protein [Gaiellaceae bacterium]
MKRIFAALFAVAALTVVGSASADAMRYGVSDDWPKFHPCGDVWWSAAKDIGYQDLRMTVKWDAGAPTSIPYQANLQLAVDCALLNNIRPILAIYPLQPSAIGSSDAAQQSFSSFVALVAQAFPQVTNFVVGNEPNVNRFWQPQYVNGQDAAAKDYEHTLALSYDKLKVARPDALVWGPAISSRGNDNPNAASNPSHSPVWFIKYMGDAYKASGRTKRIFDEFDFHPYPPTQDTDPFSKKFQWPQAGAANLDRIKQALWDGFYGTAQPTVTEQSGGALAAFAAPQTLPINMDEAGEQTAVTGHEPAYDGAAENVTPISEAQQSANHVELAEIGACDPAVKTVLWFPLIDDTGISSGFQSGNLFADLTKKQSYAGMKNKIASAKGNCQGGVKGVPQTWSHATGVIGAQAIFGGPGTEPGAAPPNRPSGISSLQTSVTANEDAAYKASVIDAQGATVASAQGTVKAYFRPAITLTRAFTDGNYTIAIELTAATNPARTVRLTSPAFRVGTEATAAFSDAYGSMNPWLAEYVKSTLTANGITTIFATQNDLAKAMFLLIGKLGASYTSYQLCVAMVGAYTVIRADHYSTCVSTRLPSTASGPAFIKRALVKKGTRPHFKSFPLKKVKAGYYRVIMTLTPVDGRRPAMLNSQRFYVNAKHRIVPSKTKAKAPVKKKK